MGLDCYLFLLSPLLRRKGVKKYKTFTLEYLWKMLLHFLEALESIAPPTQWKNFRIFGSFYVGSNSHV